MHTNASMFINKEYIPKFYHVCFPICALLSAFSNDLAKRIIFKYKTKMPLGLYTKNKKVRLSVCVVLYFCYTQTSIMCKVEIQKYVIIIPQSISVCVCCGRYTLYKKLLPTNHVSECSHTFPLTNTLMFQMVISTFVQS